MAKKKTGLGERHIKIMTFLEKFQKANGYSPSIREIGKNIGVNSTSLVDYYLKQLEEKGFIERNQNISRSIRIIRFLTPEGKVKEETEDYKSTLMSNLVSIPVAGRIVASNPIPMPVSDVNYYDPETSVDIARSLLPTKENESELFALEVDGDSMVDAMINDGDIVIMKRAQQADNGEMVAVWIDDNDETTLKYFYKEKNRIRLQPANPTMKPIFINDLAKVRIMGKVVLVIRQVKKI